MMKKTEKQLEKRLERKYAAIEKVHVRYNKKVKAKIDMSNKLSHDASLLRQKEGAEIEKLYAKYRSKKK